MGAQPRAPIAPPAAASATLTECAVLGLLTFGERSGYDLLKLAAGSIGFFFAPGRSQLYAVLPKLVARGLVTVRHVEQSDRPDKQLYRLTPAGREALRAGLQHPHPTIDRDPYQLALFFGGELEPGAVRAMVAGRRDRAVEHLARLEEIERELDVDESFYPWLTLLLGKEDAQATARWADRVLVLLEERGL